MGAVGKTKNRRHAASPVGGVVVNSNAPGGEGGLLGGGWGKGPFGFPENKIPFTAVTIVVNEGFGELLREVEK